MRSYLSAVRHFRAKRADDREMGRELGRETSYNWNAVDLSGSGKRTMRSKTHAR